MQSLKLVALAMCLFAVSSSIAAPFPASSQSAPAARGAANIEAFQEFVQLKKCKFASCIVAFPAVTNTQILIQHISCFFVIKTGGTLELAFLGKSGAQDFDSLSANKLGSVIDGELYSISAQAYFFVSSGQAPQVTIVAAPKNAEGVTCTISGQHVPQPE